MGRAAGALMSPCPTQSTTSGTKKYPITHLLCAANLPGGLRLDVLFFLGPSGSTPPAGLFPDVMAAAPPPHAQEHTLVFDLLAQFDGVIGAGDRFAVDLQDDIAGLQAGRRRWRGRVQVHHQRATAHLVGDVQLSARARVEV